MIQACIQGFSLQCLFGNRLHSWRYNGKGFTLCIEKDSFWFRFLFIILVHDRTGHKISGRLHIPPIVGSVAVAVCIQKGVPFDTLVVRKRANNVASNQLFRLIINEPEGKKISNVTTDTNPMSRALF